MKAYGKNIICKKVESNELVASSNIKEYDVISIGDEVNCEDLINATIFTEKAKHHNGLYIIDEEDVLAYSQK